MRISDWSSDVCSSDLRRPHMPLIQDEDIAQLLRETDTIAMIGISDNPTRPSYGVMAFLQEQGHRVIPVNPQIAGEHVHGEFVWASLDQVGVPIDMVDIFRRSERSEEHTSELQSLMRT